MGIPGHFDDVAYVRGNVLEPPFIHYLHCILQIMLLSASHSKKTMTFFGYLYFGPVALCILNKLFEFEYVTYFMFQPLYFSWT